MVSALVDCNEYAAETYLANVPNAPYFTHDLTCIRPSTIERMAGGTVDILLGCPPCQGFSETGARNTRDARNAHLTNFARLAIGLQPLAIGMENVPLAAGGRRFGMFVKTLEAAGYIWTAGVLNAALRGSCQCRHRLVFIALRGDVGVTPIIPQPSSGGTRKRFYCYGTATYKTIGADRVSMLGEAPAARRVRRKLPVTIEELGDEVDIPTVGECLEGLPPIDSREAKRIQHFSWAHTEEVLQRMEKVREGWRWEGGSDHYSQTYGRLHRAGLARTITTFFPNSGGGRFWHPTENRALSLREAARIQGFPDYFRFKPHYSKAAVLVGNALDASISTTIYSVIRDSLS